MKQGLIKRELEGSEKRLVALSKKRDEYQNISMEQVNRYKWYPDSGSIYDRVTGRFIYTDRITYFTDKTRRRIVARSDGFIYFTKNNKNYKVAIPNFETIKTETPHPLTEVTSVTSVTEKASVIISIAGLLGLMAGLIAARSGRGAGAG